MTSAYQSESAKSRACFPFVSRDDTGPSAEVRVMDLWDEGLSIRKIAKRLNRPNSYVSEIISRFAPTAQDRRTGPAAIADGSRRLLAALRRYHPERMRG